jgi:hypothetical protein
MDAKEIRAERRRLKRIARAKSRRKHPRKPKISSGLDREFQRIAKSA